MSTTSIPTPFPVDDSDPNKFLQTDDWKRTERFLWEFSNDCLDKLRDAQCAGRGYFIEAPNWQLKDRLQEAIYKEDFVSVANYAMMLHTQNKIQEERDKWHEFHQAKLNIQPPAPNEDDPF